MSLIDKYIKQGFALRILFSILVLFLPFSSINKILLIFLFDSIDCKYSEFFLKNYPCSTFLYQKLDKIVDLLSYLLIYLYFNLLSIYNIIILFRLIGVVLFYFTKNSKWLIIFPDIFKEVWIFETFISKITIYNLIIIIILKDIFEYVWHTYKNKNKYK
jgi:hypothetical protein